MTFSTASRAGPVLAIVALAALTALRAAADSKDGSRHPRPPADAAGNGAAKPAASSRPATPATTPSSAAAKSAVDLGKAQLSSIAEKAVKGIGNQKEIGSLLADRLKASPANPFAQSAGSSVPATHPSAVAATPTTSAAVARTPAPPPAPTPDAQVAGLQRQLDAETARHANRLAELEKEKGVVDPERPKHHENVLTAIQQENTLYSGNVDALRQQIRAAEGSPSAAAGH